MALVPEFVVQRLFHPITKTRWNLHRIRYDLPGRSDRLLLVDPNNIATMNKDISYSLGLGRVIGGDWDRAHCRPLADSYVVRGLRQRFVHGFDWEETDYFKRAVEKIEARGHWWGYETVDEFLSSRCEFVDQLYQSIRDDGYKPNTEIGHSVPDTDHRNGKKAYKHALESLILIDRDGSIQLRDGFHRVTLVQLLGIDRIPVHVLARHAQWQATREELYRQQRRESSGESVELSAHPDLLELDVNP